MTSRRLARAVLAGLTAYGLSRCGFLFVEGEALSAAGFGLGGAAALWGYVREVRAGV